VASTIPDEALSSWGGEGRPLVFAHANGFPPATYRALLEQLADSFLVRAFAARALWPSSDPAAVGSWRELADDLERTLVLRGLTGAVGVGHSLGGVLSLMVASRRRDILSSLVLIDPVLFTGPRATSWWLLRTLGGARRLPLVRGALRRRDHFPSCEEVLRSYRRKPVFRSWQPQVLEGYVRDGFRSTADGQVELRYSKAWEARIFELTPASVWRDVRRLEVPLLVIRGTTSDTFLPNAAARLQRYLPHARSIEMDGSHFLPMEHPRAVVEKIVDWVEIDSAGAGRGSP
jgi:pimeloyl-ACP methyl ester carboxylesterase